MKKILFVIAAFFEVVFAESPETEIVLKYLKVDDTVLGPEICDSIYLGVSTAEMTRYKISCVAHGDGIEYNSPIDYSVVFYLIPNWVDGESVYIKIRRENQTCTNPNMKYDSQGTPGTAQFSEVLLAELIRLQKYHVVQNTPDSLELLLQSAISKAKEISPCDDIDLAFYEEASDFYNVIWPGCCSLVKYPDASPSVAWTPSSIRFTKMGESRFFIHGIPNGSDYTLFDLNGKVLKQGVMLSKIIQPPMLPAILKIQNQIMMLK